MEYKNKKINCQNCKNDFTIETEDFSFYEKKKVPAPTFCPGCRFQRRLLFRNNRVFYKSKCALCNKQILSLYHKDSPYTIYCCDCWFSDKWNAMNYGREYDFSIPFFTQFRSLQKEVPRANLHGVNFIMSDYCNYGLDFKECYLSFGGTNNERIYFGNQIVDSNDTLDISFSSKIEFSYEVFESKLLNKVFFSSYSNNCVESNYLIDCRNCMNCFGCVGLVNKKYNIFNKQHSRDEYEKFLKNNEGSYSKHLENLKKLKELKLTVPHRFARIYMSVNSDGDDLFDVRNTHMSFTSGHVENSKYLFFCRRGTKDCYDNTFQGFNSELVYETADGFGGHNVTFCMKNIFLRDASYNEDCHECSNIFGCEGLRKKNYCILNKQYTKEEYVELLPKIIQHMNDMSYLDQRGLVYKYGEFFPSELSPFAYNETIAQEYFPLTKEEALELGYKWEEREMRNYKIDIENKDIPDNIRDIKDDIVGKVIACAHSGKCKEQCTEAFKIVPEEFKFYKRMNLPLPRLCPNCRHYQRINLRNPLRLWDRQCVCIKEEHFHGKKKCIEKFKTTYAPERSEIIYCEKCYQQEIY
jgi:hypothetical protein